MTSNARAFALGTVAVFSISTVTVVAVMNGFADSFPFVWGSLFVAGFITAYVATSQRLLLATGLAIPAAVALALFNWAWDAFGRGSDFKGLSGSLVVFGFSLVIDSFLALCGGALGALVSRWMTPNNSLERTREG
jgi:hypothetical protein